MLIDRYRRLWVQMVSLLSTYLCMYDCSLRRLYCTQHVYKYLSLSLLVYYVVSRTEHLLERRTTRCQRYVNLGYWRLFLA